MNRIALFVTACILFVTPSGAQAATDFGVPHVVSSGPFTGNYYELSPEIATDGHGVWITAWVVREPEFGLTVDERSIAYSRSLDDGETWSAPQIMRPEFETDFSSATTVHVATDGNGKWIAVHASPDSSDGTSTVSATTSTDNGATWGAPVTIVTSDDWHGRPRIASDGASTWFLAWESDDPTLSGSEDWIGVLGSRSTDGGNTWSAPALIAGDNNCYYCYPRGAPRIATDRAGTWIVAFETESSVSVARSTDDAVTFSATSIGFGYPYLESTPDIATDGEGRWIVGFQRTYQAVHGTMLKRSVDDGVTWTMVPIPGISVAPPRVASRGNGEWQVVGESTDSLESTIGGDYDILTLSSRDDGATWSTSTALVNLAADDIDTDYDLDPEIAVGGDRTTIVVWHSPGTPARRIYAAVGRQDCPMLPREDCRQTTRPKGSYLSVVDSDVGMDRLDWSWRYGEETTDADLYDPMGDNDYVACLYEKSGGDVALISEWDAPNGPMCNDKYCWKKATNKLLYRDMEHANGAIRRIKMRANADGKSALRLWIAGPALSPPRLPLDETAPVRIQLANLATGACWEGVHDVADRNDEIRFDSYPE